MLIKAYTEVIRVSTISIILFYGIKKVEK